MAVNFLQQFPRLPNVGKLDLPFKLSGLYRPRKAVPEHQAMVQRQASMSLVAPHGLQNLTGENNCFLNSAIQVLWHIDVFRRSLRELEGHTCIGKSCIFCALKDLFTQFQHSNQTTIPPDVLRHALAECYKEKHRFQLNLMDDAAECFEKLLEQVHYHLTGNDDLDSCAVPYCISHQCFALNILERTECVCGATSEPLSFVQFVHYISSSALVKEAQKYLGNVEDQTNNATPTPGDTPTSTESRMLEQDSSVFGKILHAASSYGEYRECPNFSHCKKNVDVKRILLNCPDIVCLGLIWDSDQPQVDDIMAVVNNIGLTLQLNDVFDTVASENALYNQYKLTAAIAYYGRHYSTFCLHSRKKEWIYFDDANFRTIGSDWSDVCEQIRKAHYQPLLLVYSNPFSDTMDVSKAPKEIQRVYQRSKNIVLSKDTSSTSGDRDAETVSDVSATGRATHDQENGEDYEHSKPPAEVINSTTLSIAPKQSDTHVGSSEYPQSTQTDQKTNRGNAPENGSNEPMAYSAVSSNVNRESVGDLMTFSVTPATIAQMTQTSACKEDSQCVSSKQSKSSPADEDNSVGDLIQFSINPSLLGNAHNSNIEFGPVNSQQLGGKHLSTPELKRAANQSTAKYFPHHETPMTDQRSISAPSFQRQSSFPFLSKQPAALQSDHRKRDVHALPQTSDFANQFPDYKSRESELLKPNWEYFSERENSSRSLSTSPEGWTVLNAAGDEEATFTTRRQPDKSLKNSDPDMEKLNNTPAITLLRRVTNYDSVSSPTLSSTTVTNSSTVSPVDNLTNSSRDVTSPTACLNPRGLAHYHSSQSRDPVYIDPDDLVFCQSPYSQHQVGATLDSASLSRNEPRDYGVNDTVKDNHYIELEFDEHSSRPFSSKESVEPFVSRQDKSSTRRSDSDENKDEFCSQPITDDPLYAIPEKVKVKLAKSRLTNSYRKDTSSSSGEGSSGALTATSTVTSSGDNPNSRRTSGAEYLSLLLQERQNARQSSLANATPPSRNLSEVSTKVTHADRSLESSTPNFQPSVHQTTSGKDHLQLMQKSNEYKGDQSRVNSGHPPVHTSSQPIGGDPMYAVPMKRKQRNDLAQQNTPSSDSSSVPIGQDPLYAVPAKAHRKVQNSKPSEPDRTEVHKSTGQAVQRITNAMPKIPELVHSRLLEARDLWAKAEAAEDSDKAVAYMLFSQHNGIIAQVLQDPSVRSNTPLYRYVLDIKEKGTKKAVALKSSITYTGASESRSSHGTCKRCGNTRKLDPNNLCGPCRLRVQIGQ